MWSALSAGGEVAPAPAPVSRCKHAGALSSEGDHVLVLGGRGARGTTPLTDFWRYDLVRGSWRRLSGSGDAPGALQEHSAVAHGHRLYVFGGQPNMTDDTPLWVYDMQTEVWRKLSGCPSPPRRGRSAPAGAHGRGASGASAPSPRGRRGHSAHGLPDCMLLYGGYVDLRGSTSELWAFHYESESWRCVRVLSAGPARHRHAGALLGERLYVHGGLQDLKACADLWHYDSISHVWSVVRCPAKQSPPARSGHAGLAAGPYFYVYGGEVDGRPTNDLWRFHTDAEMWERMEQRLQWPAPRLDCVVLGVGSAAVGAETAPGVRRATGSVPAKRPDSLLARLGGLTALGGNGARRGEYLSLESGSAESLSPLPKSRSTVAMPGRPMVQARGRLSVPDLCAETAQTTECTRPGAVPAARPQGPPPPDPPSAFDSSERLGFTNPHYLWSSPAPGETLTPDSGAQDLELMPLPSALRPPSPRYLLVLGGRETHPARQQAPLPMWLCRLP